MDVLKIFDWFEEKGTTSKMKLTCATKTLQRLVSHSAIISAVQLINRSYTTTDGKRCRLIPIMTILPSTSFKKSKYWCLAFEKRS